MTPTQGKDCVFFETAQNLRSQPHTVIECVPMKHGVASNGPMYFKKAILESESEWSQNVKLVDTRGKKKISESLPKNFPYFHVEFGLGGGFAHVIEDEKTFSKHFGRQVCAGMLKLPQEIVARPKRNDMESDKKRVTAFSEIFEPHDWTKML